MVFESCCTSADVVHVLRLRYGFPIDLVAHRPTILCGERVGAVSMPIHLGYRVLDLVVDRPVPVVSNPRDTVWTFLVGPAFAPVGPYRLRRLAECGIAVHDRGHRVMMPMSDTGFGWRWACEPAAGALRLPPRVQVLDAAESLLDSGPIQVGCG